ncbi:galactose-binding domain-like protein [Halteromyces radiatus]|uniref:galactose-binding domain-like protein n=1 Tax=Halteromyces radiatus TaxID=101107 RepID=UPI00221F5098|nr:galactose-binding domain-like protein [Halteromyces radiatus]KAI8089139.1 galactose-binding domain-like protein [Halteromyces radiatus]
MSSTSLINQDTRIKVSSVLNRDTPSFGKQHLIDGSEETCWNSEQGLPQHILIDFGTPATVTDIILTFQGGFVGKTCVALGSTADQPNDYSVHLATFYPQDINPMQTFPIPNNNNVPIQRLKLIFEESTDFYGRITIYKLDVLGTR